MKISPRHTFIVALLNAFNIIVNLSVTASNIGWIDLDLRGYEPLNYLSEIFFFYILVYLLFAFKHFDSQKRYVGFAVYIFFVAAMYFSIPITPGYIRGDLDILFSMLTVVGFINLCYLAIISLKLTYRPLAIAYFLLFLGIIITSIIPTFAPVLVFGLGNSADSYLYIYVYLMTFISLVSSFARFYVLYRINTGLKELNEEKPLVMLDP